MTWKHLARCFEKAKSEPYWLFAEASKVFFSLGTADPRMRWQWLSSTIYNAASFRPITYSWFGNPVFNRHRIAETWRKQKQTCYQEEVSSETIQNNSNRTLLNLAGQQCKDQLLSQCKNTPWVLICFISTASCVRIESYVLHSDTRQ